MANSLAQNVNKPEAPVLKYTIKQLYKACLQAATKNSFGLYSFPP